MCSVHQEIFSTSGVFITSGGVQYIGQCSVNWGVFSTLGECHKYIGGVQYIEGMS